MAHIRQSTPDCNLGFKAKALKTFEVVPTWLGSGRQRVSERVREGVRVCGRESGRVREGVRECVRESDSERISE
jgi:hypothetical protein